MKFGSKENNKKPPRRKCIIYACKFRITLRFEIFSRITFKIFKCNILDSDLIGKYI